MIRYALKSSRSLSYLLIGLAIGVQRPIYIVGKHHGRFRILHLASIPIILFISKSQFFFKSSLFLPKSISGNMDSSIPSKTHHRPMRRSMSRLFLCLFFEYRLWWIRLKIIYRGRRGSHIGVMIALIQKPP